MDVGLVLGIPPMADCAAVPVVAYPVFTGERSSCDARDKEDRQSNNNEKPYGEESAGY